jgi:hypothetical protein
MLSPHTESVPEDGEGKSLDHAHAAPMRLLERAAIALPWYGIISDLNDSPVGVYLMYIEQNQESLCAKLHDSVTARVDFDIHSIHHSKCTPTYGSVSLVKSTPGIAGPCSASHLNTSPLVGFNHLEISLPA